MENWYGTLKNNRIVEIKRLDYEPKDPNIFPLDIKLFKYHRKRRKDYCSFCNRIIELPKKGQNNDHWHWQENPKKQGTGNFICKKLAAYYAYLIRNKNNDNPAEYKPGKIHKREVLQFNKKHKLLKIWESCRSVDAHFGVSQGYTRIHIMKKCKSNKSPFNNFIWEFNTKRIVIRDIG